MIEYEARVLEINKENLEETLKMLNAQKIADFDYKRRVYDFNPKSNGKWIRLRTDGRKTTLTIKEIRSDKIDGTDETEIEVSDFQTTNIILNKLGYIAKSYQENKRSRWTLDRVEIDIDTWPYIPTYVEIEGHSTEEVKQMIEKLKLDKDKATSLDVQSIYLEVYGIDITKLTEIKFDEVELER